MLPVSGFLRPQGHGSQHVDGSNPTSLPTGDAPTPSPAPLALAAMVPESMTESSAPMADSSLASKRPDVLDGIEG